MDIDSILKTEALTEHQAINVYSEIQDDCNQLGFPITPRDELALVKSCRPQNHGVSKEIMLNISKTIFRRLSFVIPSTNLVMKEMIEPYAMDRDGYACLWSLMRRSCDFMRPEPEGWGPPWPMNGTVNGTPEKYVVALQSWCSTTNIRNNKKYTHFQQFKRNSLPSSSYIQKGNCNQIGHQAVTLVQYQYKRHAAGNMTHHRYHR